LRGGRYRRDLAIGGHLHIGSWRKDGPRRNRMETWVLVVANLGGRTSLMSACTTSTIGRKRHPTLAARSCATCSCVSGLLCAGRHGRHDRLCLRTGCAAGCTALCGAGSLLFGAACAVEPRLSVAFERPVAAQNQPVPRLIAAAHKVCSQAASNDGNHDVSTHIFTQESTSPRQLSRDGIPGISQDRAGDRYLP
jgi:hypothetical protein